MRQALGALMVVLVSCSSGNQVTPAPASSSDATKSAAAKSSASGSTSGAHKSPNWTASTTGGGTTAGLAKDPAPIGGESVANDCSSCDALAAKLAPQAGFTADPRKTLNCGPYQGDPSRNLCDIRFMADINGTIQDNSAHVSVLNQQVAIYCPCSCQTGRDSCVNQPPAAPTIAPPPPPPGSTGSTGSATATSTSTGTGGFGSGGGGNTSTDPNSGIDPNADFGGGGSFDTSFPGP